MWSNELTSELLRVAKQEHRRAAIEQEDKRLERQAKKRVNQIIRSHAHPKPR